MSGFAGEGGGEPLVHNGQSQVFTHHTGAHGHHIGVVVQSGQLRGQQVAEQRAADALYLVGGNGYADAGGAQQNALFAGAGGNRPGGGTGKIGVVAAVLAVGAEVHHFIALGAEMGSHLLLQIKRSMVTGNCDFHLYPPHIT